MKPESVSFIIRIWVESVSDDNSTPVWRGVIEQVGNAEKRHFHDLDTVTQFIQEKTEIERPRTLLDRWLEIQKNLTNEIRKRLHLKH